VKKAAYERLNHDDDDDVTLVQYTLQIKITFAQKCVKCFNIDFS